MSNDILSGFLLNVAAGVFQSLLEYSITKGYKLLSDNPDSALNIIYKTALEKDMLYSLGTLSEEQQQYYGKKLERILTQPDVQEMLLDIAANGHKPDREKLLEIINELNLRNTDIYLQFFDNYFEMLVDMILQDAEGETIHEKVAIRLLKTIYDDLQKLKRDFTFPQPPTPCPSAPTPPAHAVGRADDLANLKAKLTAGERVSIVSVKAMGGMGKTTLAQMFCHQPDLPFRAVLWAEIKRNPTSTKIRQQLQTWAHLAGMSGLPPEIDDDAKLAELIRPNLERLINTHCGGTLLVVFDDVWDDEACYLAVNTLKLALPAERVELITTRSDKVANRLHSESVSLDKLPDNEASTLLDELITRADFTADHKSRLLTMLDGHPLAIKLAAESVKNADDGDDITDILDEYAYGLKNGTRFDAMDLQSERPDILNVVFQHSYDALPENAQIAFRALGVLVDDSIWDGELAAGLWHMESEDETDTTAQKAVRDLHKTLRAHGLLSLFTPEPDDTTTYVGTWYTQHALLRAYARALLKDSGELDDTWSRYSDAVIAIAHNFLELQNQPEEWGFLTPYLPHIHHIGDLLVEKYTATPDDTALRGRALAFASRTHHYLHRRREVGQTTTLNWLTMGLNAAIAGDNKRLEGLFLNNLALFHSAVGEKHSALGYYERQLIIVRKIGDKQGEAATLNNIGGVSHALGDHHKALDFYQRALPIQQAIGDRSGVATTLNNIGSVWHELDNHHKALDFYNQALPILRSVGNRSVEAVTCYNVGSIHYRLGNLDEAIHYLERCVELDEQVYHPNLEQDCAFLQLVKRERDGLPPLPQTIPQETIDFLIDTTVAVKTHNFEQLDKWKSGLLILRADFVRHGENLAVTFADALLNILTDQPASLPDDNPYQPHLQRVLDGIANPPEPPQEEELTQEEQAAEFWKQIMELYNQSGENGVRSALKQAGAPNDAIETVIAQIKSTLE